MLEDDLEKIKVKLSKGGPEYRDRGRGDFKGGGLGHLNKDLKQEQLVMQIAERRAPQAECTRGQRNQGWRFLKCLSKNYQARVSGLECGEEKAIKK